MSKCVRQLLLPALLLTLLGVTGCELFSRFTSGGGVDDPSRPALTTHPVVVSGDASTAAFSPDPVEVYAGDQIQWSHANPDAGLIIHLDSLPADSQYLEIGPGEYGRVTVDRDAPLNPELLVDTIKYAVTVRLGGEVETFDPYVVVRRRPR